MNGELNLTLKPDTSNVRCICGTTKNYPFTSTFGTIAEVNAVAMVPGEESFVSALAMVEAWHLGFDPAMGTLFFRHQAALTDTYFGRVPWDPTLRWWRVRADDAGLAVLGEVSEDGENWRRIGVDDRKPAPMMILSSFQVTTSQPIATPSTVRVDSFNICPP